MRLHRKPIKTRIEILPLLDVVFLLLVFFIYAMMLMTVHRGMKLDLPQSLSASAEAASVLALSIKADGTIFLGKDPSSLSDLPEKLTSYKQNAVKSAESGQSSRSDPDIQIFAEANLPYQELFKVLDILKSAGLERISLQARQSENR